MKQKQTNSEFGNPFKEQEHIFISFKRVMVIQFLLWCGVLADLYVGRFTKLLAEK